MSHKQRFKDDFMIAYNPNGAIEVNKHPDTTGWSDKYALTVGCCFSFWDELNDGQKLDHLVALALQIRGDGVNTESLLQEFGKIGIWNERLTETIKEVDHYCQIY